MTLKKLSRNALFEAYEVSYSLTEALLAVIDAIAAHPQRLVAAK